MGADAAALQKRILRPVGPMRRLAVALVLSLLLAPRAAPAQEAPPHVDEAPRQMGQAGQATPRTAAPATQPRPPIPARPAPPKPGPAVKNDAKRHLRSLDENHDGRVTKQEYLARAREAFAELDLDRDGALSPPELEQARALARKRRDEARRRAGKPPISRKAGEARPLPLSGRDLDGNGRITLREYLAKREQAFAQLDRSRDGIVSREEARAAKGRILARRAELRTEKREVAQRQVQRQAARDEKLRARKRRAARHAELAAEREARVQRRVERMAGKAGAQWGLSPEAAALAPQSDTAAPAPTAP